MSKIGNNAEDCVSFFLSLFKDRKYLQPLNPDIFQSLFKRLQSVTFTDSPDFAMKIADARAVSGHNFLTIMKEHNLPWDEGSWTLGENFKEFVSRRNQPEDELISIFSPTYRTVKPNISEDDIRLMINFGIKGIKEGPVGERIFFDKINPRKIKTEYGLPISDPVYEQLTQIYAQSTRAKYSRLDKGAEYPGRDPALAVTQLQGLNQQEIRDMVKDGVDCQTIADRVGIIRGGWAWNEIEVLVATYGPAADRVRAGEPPRNVALSYGMSIDGSGIKELRKLAPTNNRP